MPGTRVLVATIAACSVLSGFSRTAATGQQPPQPPRFQSSVEVTSVDVTVVDERGQPITTLTPSDFNVRIDGNPRRVITAEWISLVTPGGAAAPAAPVPDGFTTNDNAAGGRLIVISVDEPNIRFGGALGIARAANAFIDRLSSSD